MGRNRGSPASVSAVSPRVAALCGQRTRLRTPERTKEATGEERTGAGDAGLLSAGSVDTVESCTLAVGGQLALWIHFAIGHAIAGATHFSIAATRAVAVRHAESSALCIDALFVGTTICVRFALWQPASIGTAHT